MRMMPRMPTKRPAKPATDATIFSHIGGMAMEKPKHIKPATSARTGTLERLLNSVISFD